MSVCPEYDAQFSINAVPYEAYSLAVVSAGGPIKVFLSISIEELSL